MRRLAQSQTASPGRGVSLTRGQLECQRSPTSWTTAYSSERCESAYVRGHIPRAYHVELRPAFAAWVGWVVPFGTPIIFVSDAPGAPEEAVRQLRRIGHDELPGWLSRGRQGGLGNGRPADRAHSGPDDA